MLLKIEQIAHSSIYHTSPTHSSPIINILHYYGTLLTIDKPILIML